MEPTIDHIEITVKDMNVAVPFYDKLLPLLGFDLQTRVGAVMEEHDKQVVQYEHPRLGFAITSRERLSPATQSIAGSRGTSSSCFQSNVSRRSRIDCILS